MVTYLCNCKQTFGRHNGMEDVSEVCGNRPAPLRPPFPCLTLEVGPLLRLEGLGERFSSPSRSGRSPAPAAKRYLVNFRLKISHLEATIFSCFSRNETPNWDTGWPSGNILLCRQTVWTSQWHGRRFARMWQRFLASPSQVKGAYF